ncbi:MAG: hypothetical protein HOY71_08780 [Nonomuraea sp.]|nr:hypothetical protein [Nonomuraea sp.]
MVNILVSGSGIAGTVLAYWLRERGHTPTVVEKAAAPRRGGQAVDIRGVALEVAERMGVRDRAHELRTRLRGMSMVDGDGKELMRTTETTISGGPLDSPDIEIMREDLMTILLETTMGVEYRYGDSIAAVDGGRVRFESGREEVYDHVVGADGLHSNVRRLVFGEQELEHLGMYVSIFTTDNFLGLDRWQTWYREGEAGCGIYSVPGNERMLVNLGFGGPERVEYDHRDVQAQRRLVAERCAGMRWEGPRLIKAMWESDDFYFDAAAQVHLDRWTRDGVSLVGDAGYCASLLSGQGTSLAMVGAYVLAEELSSGTAERYEERMRPFVALNQALAKENPGGPASEESVARAANAITL